MAMDIDATGQHELATRIDDFIGRDRAIVVLEEPGDPSIAGEHRAGELSVLGYDRATPNRDCPHPHLRT